MQSKEKAKTEAKPAKKAKAASRQAIPSLDDVDFSSDAATSDGNKWNWKFASWNVNGVRAWFDVSYGP